MKKLKNKIIIAITLMLSLVSICFITTKTYAYTIDDNGNLIGDNLLIGNTFNKTAVNTNIYYNTNLVINNTYTFSIQNGTNSGQFAIFWNSANSSGTLTGGYNVNSPFTFIAPDNITSLRIFCNNVNNANLMLNKGNNKIDWEPYGIWYSENNYEILENQYNSLINQNNIFGENIQSQKIYFNNTEQTYSDWNYIFTTEQRTIYIDVDGFRDIYDGIGANTDVRYELILNNSFSSINIIGKITTPYDIAISGYNNNNENVFTIDYSTTSGELANGEFDYPQTIDIKKIIIETTINDNQYGRNKSYIDFGGTYASGYIAGVNENNTYWKNQANKYEDTIRAKNNKIQELNNTIEQKNTEITQAYNNGYQNGYNLGANSENSLYNMVIAVADTPITIFKQIFNFNILGLDISGFIFGIISLLIIIWLIKKII